MNRTQHASKGSEEGDGEYVKQNLGCELFQFGLMRETRVTCNCNSTEPGATAGTTEITTEIIGNLGCRNEYPLGPCPQCPIQVQGIFGL